MKTNKYKFDVSYSTRRERNDRTIKVAEAFGLGLEDRTFVVLDGVEVEVQSGDVIYIEGQSGSGKSTLLRELEKAMVNDGYSVMNLESVELEDVPLINQLSPMGDIGDAMRSLSIAGISDAYLYISKPKELSDGQRYRFRLAKLLEANADVWIADEFGAVLDRVTAKVVAYNMQKVARENNKILIVATTHTDLVDELSPSLRITKRFHDRIAIDDRRLEA